MSLLDDVSILITPNGYKAGTLHAAIPTPTEGAELVTNGDFATDSGWTKGTGWAISGGKANCDGTQSGTSELYQGVVYPQNTLFKIQYTISNYSSGQIKPMFFGDGSGVYQYTDGVVVEYVTVSNTGNGNFGFAATSTFIGTIDNVSVKEYTSADMDVTRSTAATRVDENGLVNYAEVIGGDVVTNGDFANGETDWTFSAQCEVVNNQVRILSTDGSFQYISQNNVFDTSKNYKLEFDIISSNGATLGMGGGIPDVQTTTLGRKTIYTSSSVSYLQIKRSSGVTDVVIDNVSVKEVTRDNVPRIDYTGGGCPHILAEPQRTNLITYSNTTNQWTDIGITYSVDSTISPDGTLNGSKAIINDTITSSNTRPMTSVSTTSGLDYVFSVFGKADEFDIINLDFSNAAFGTVSVTYNLTDGTVTSFAGSPVSQGVEDYGNGWYRCYVVATAIATGTSALIIRLDANPTGDGTSGLYIYGASLEQGSYPTSYIPTSGSTVTRNQDIFTRDGIGSLINSTEGVLFLEIAALSDDLTNREITLSDGTGSNYVLIRFNSGGSNRIYTRVDVGGGGGLQYFNLDTSHTITDANKIAIRWEASNFATFINGVKIDFQLSGSSFAADTLNELNFDNGGGLNPFFGKVKQLQVYNTSLSDTQLAALTS